MNIRSRIVIGLVAAFVLTSAGFVSALTPDAGILVAPVSLTIAAKVEPVSHADPQIIRLMKEHSMVMGERSDLRQRFDGVHASAEPSLARTPAPAVPPVETTPESVAPIVKAKLEVLAVSLERIDYKGGANMDYWFWTRTSLANQTLVDASILEDLVKTYGPKMGDALQAAVSKVAGQLNALGHKFDGSGGDLNFWIKAVTETKQGMRDAARNLREIIKTL